MAYLSPVLTLIIAAVKKTSSALARDFNELEHLQNGVHGDSSFALRSAERTERILKEELSKIKAGYPVIVKNDEVIPTSGNYFLLSPIDGFVNFAHANGNFAISVALVEKNTVVDLKKLLSKGRKEKCSLPKKVTALSKKVFAITKDFALPVAKIWKKL